MDTSQTQLAYVANSAGATPSNPAFKLLRFTSESILPNIQYLSSDEIRPSRDVPDLTQVGGDAGGEIAGELSYATYDDLFEALLCGTWASNVLKNGVVDREFTFEKKIEGGATDYYHRLLKAKINTLTLSLAAKQKATVSFGIMGSGVTAATAALSGATYADPNANPIMNASTGFQSLTMSGITQPELMSLNLSVTNNMAQQDVMGQIGSKGVRKGQFVVTGSFEAYFANNDMLSAYINNTQTTLGFEIGGATEMKYEFEMNGVKFSNVRVATPGNNQDVMASVDFQAILNATDNATLKITRTPAA